MMLVPRRSFLLGLGSLLCAPAVVRASSLMPLRASWHDWGEIVIDDWLRPNGDSRLQDLDLLGKARDYALQRRLKIAKFELETVATPIEYKFQLLFDGNSEAYQHSMRRLSVMFKTRELNPDRTIELLPDLK
jgi:hypothetical protein